MLHHLISSSQCLLHIARKWKKKWKLWYNSFLLFDCSELKPLKNDICSEILDVDTYKAKGNMIPSPDVLYLIYPLLHIFKYKRSFEIAIRKNGGEPIFTRRREMEKHMQFILSINRMLVKQNLWIWVSLPKNIFLFLSSFFSSDLRDLWFYC